MLSRGVGALRAAMMVGLAGLAIAACAFHTSGEQPGAGGASSSSSGTTSSTTASSSGGGALPCSGPDSDGDGVSDGCDICGGHDDEVDTDGDGVPDGCEKCEGHDDGKDADGDGVPDGCDVCASGDDKVDSDHDGVPDGCDKCEGSVDGMDTDHDGVPDGCDKCPSHDDKVDADGDGVPDGCDKCPAHDDKADADGDGVPDGCDICAGHDDHVDVDGDGAPDGCDPCPHDGPTATAVQDSYTESSTSAGKTTSLAIEGFVFDGSNNVLVVAPGTTVHASYTVKFTDCICTGCADQLEIGPLPDGPVACGSLGNPGCGSTSASAGATFKAPSTPGVYPIGFKLAQDNYCFKSGPGWYGGAPSAASTVGVLCVQ